MRIGNWSVRTLYAQEKAAQAVKAMGEATLQIMGISESRWCGSEKFTLSTGETIVNPVRDNDVHQHGVGIMLNKDAEKVMINQLLVITGDINAKVGRDFEAYERVMGRHGVGSGNENGERLCDFCGMNDLVTTDTLFPHKVICRQKWIPPDTWMPHMDTPLATRSIAY